MERKIRILVLAANSRDSSRLALDEELRQMLSRIRSAEQGTRFEMHAELALRPGELPAALMRHQPDIVHFSSHGTSHGALCLVNERTGQTQHVSGQQLVDIFTPLSSGIQCVVLSACYSEIQSRALVTCIPCVVGMSRAVKDEAAIAFSAGFYEALAFGKSVKTAFEVGRAHMGLLPEHEAGMRTDAGSEQRSLRKAPANENPDQQKDIPQLVHRADVDPAKVFLLSSTPPAIDKPIAPSPARVRTPPSARYVAPVVGGAVLLAASLIAWRFIPSVKPGTVTDPRPQSPPDASVSALLPKEAPIAAAVINKEKRSLIDSGMKSPDSVFAEFSKKRIVIDALAHCQGRGKADSGLDIKVGDRISFTAADDPDFPALLQNDGKDTGRCTPNGCDSSFQNIRYGSLVGRIGDLIPVEFFKIGTKLDDYPADRDGRLYMVYWNDQCEKSKGSYRVDVTVRRPAKPPSSDKRPSTPPRTKNCLSATSFARLPVRVGQSVSFKATISSVCDPKGWSSGGSTPEYSGPRGVGEPKSKTLHTSFPVGALMFGYSTKDTHNTLEVWDILGKCELMFYDNGYDPSPASVDGYLYMMFNDLRDSMQDNLGSLLIEAKVNGKRVDIEK